MGGIGLEHWRTDSARLLSELFSQSNAPTSPSPGGEGGFGGSCLAASGEQDLVTPPSPSRPLNKPVLDQLLLVGRRGLSDKNLKVDLAAPATALKVGACAACLNSLRPWLGPGSALFEIGGRGSLLFRGLLVRELV